MAFPKLVGCSIRARSGHSIRCPACRSGPNQPTVAAPANAASRRALGGGSAAQPQPRRLREPAGAADHHAGRAARAGEAASTSAATAAGRAPISVIRVRVAGVTGPDPASLEPDQGGRRADRGAHPPDRGHRRRIVPVADHHLAAGRLVRPAAAAADRGLGQEGRRGRDPGRGRPQQRGAVRADPRGLRAVRGQLGDRRGPRPPAGTRRAGLPGLDPAPAVRGRAGRGRR